MTTLSTAEWSVPAWVVLAVAVLAAALLVVALVLGIGRGRVRRRAYADVAELSARIDELQTRLDRTDGSGLGTGSLHSPGSTSGRAEYVITSLGEADAAEPVTLSAPAFADAVLRESVVHTAALLHGVRRALAPEIRNRIWFEMRREVKRTRKERKIELREALREYRARHRAEVPADGPSRVADGAA